MGRYYLFLSLLITQIFLKWVVIIHFYHYSLLSFFLKWVVIIHFITHSLSSNESFSLSIYYYS